jgi:hypothetical protein
MLDQSPASLHEPLLQAGEQPRRQFSSAAGGDATGCQIVAQEAQL